MVFVFALAQLIKNNSIVDVFWGIGFLVSSSYLFFYHNQFAPKQLLIVGLVACWALRLSIFLFIRNYKKPEDWRYQNFRKMWGNYPYLGAFFQVFMLQGFFMYIILLPVQILFIKKLVIINWYNLIGIAVAIFAIAYEAIADYQLYVFKKNKSNHGKTMKFGLWQYSRHPNYFAEIVFWWAIFFAVVQLNDPQYTLVALISPITITWLLNKVSGVPMLESKYKNDLEYQEYIKNTPALLPKFF